MPPTRRVNTVCAVSRRVKTIEGTFQENARRRYSLHLDPLLPEPFIVSQWRPRVPRRSPSRVRAAQRAGAAFRRGCGGGGAAVCRAPRLPARARRALACARCQLTRRAPSRARSRDQPACVAACAAAAAADASLSRRKTGARLRRLRLTRRLAARSAVADYQHLLQARASRASGRRAGGAEASSARRVATAAAPPVASPRVSDACRSPARLPIRAQQQGSCLSPAPGWRALRRGGGRKALREVSSGT